MIVLFFVFSNLRVVFFFSRFGLGVYWGWGWAANGRRQFLNHQSYTFMEPDGVSKLLYFLVTIPRGMFSILGGYLLIDIYQRKDYITKTNPTQSPHIHTYIINKKNPIPIKQPYPFNMLKSLSVPQSQLPIPQRLLQICKKSAITNDGKPQIDFLLLDREMQQLQQIQSKTCQQIVEFVDEHLEEFIDINRRFQIIQDNVNSTEMLIKKLIPKLDMYKNSLFSPESKIQDFMTNYQKKLMQQKLSQAAKQQTQFLLQFIHNFEVLINLNMAQLTHKHKYLIVRMLKKKQYIRSIFEHPLIKNLCHNSNDLSILLSNVTEELEFYLSEQLSRVASQGRLRSARLEDDGFTMLEEMQIWYQYIGKQQVFFDTVEDSIIGRQLSALELTLIAHKQSLIVGNQEHILKQFFLDLFTLVQEFPIGYPMDRILKIIYRFLGKKELNFLYSYVVPTFPISYSAYKSALQKIQNKSLRTQLETRHGWNLKLWADLRIKTIMDRSGKDKDKSLLKWIDIVFKKSFMIYGVKNHMIKLAFMLVNRFCFKIEQQMEYNTKNFNEITNVLQNIDELLRSKLMECFDDELNGNNKDQLKQKLIREQTSEVINSIHRAIDASLKKWLKVNLQTVINTCKSSLQPYKSLIMNIISKKDRQRISFNNQQNILKPLRAYIKNNPDLSEASCKFAQDLTLELLEKHYDSEYAKQIYNHCDTNISKQQMKLVMEVVALERQTLFQREKSANE